MNGVGIGMEENTKILPARAPSAPLRALTGWIVAVVGSTTRGARASPTAAGATRPAATAVRVFVFPGLSLRIVPLNPCVRRTSSS